MTYSKQINQIVVITNKDQFKIGKRHEDDFWYEWKVDSWTRFVGFRGSIDAKNMNKVDRLGVIVYSVACGEQAHGLYMMRGNYKDVQGFEEGGDYSH